MILIVCPRCACALRVIGDAEEAHQLVGQGSEFWPDDFTCFRCGGEAKGFLEPEISLKADIEIVEVTPQEALSALHGFGAPPELEFNKQSLSELLKEKRVKRVSAKDVPGAVGRCIVDFLELEDGTRVHLTSSNLGAVVYKITPPFSYAALVKT